MNGWQAALLGVIQGLTEFLPVSSSGHLVLSQALLGLELPGVTFEVVVHLATLCAVLWVYRAKVASLATGALGGKREDWVYIGLLLLASIPAAVVGIAGEGFFTGMFGKPAWAAVFLIVTGFIVWSIQYTAPKTTKAEPGPADAFGIGLAQAAAILPGISRSGSTVAVGAALGVDAVKVAEFSFLMSVPAILGAGLLQIDEIGAVADSGGTVGLSIGFIAALVSGIAAIHLFVRMLENRTFHWFAIYCWVVGSGYLLAAFLFPGLR
ncbi:MAG: undecaprenyl-diphosphate phosphatase [marine benthic group bacterium]|nr:undecaprenyl-diphosphate phosphatase [Gemmatimonadota bacterium]